MNCCLEATINEINTAEAMDTRKTIVIGLRYEEGATNKKLTPTIRLTKQQKLDSIFHE